MYDLLFNDPTRELVDELEVEAAEDGKLVIRRNTVTSVDISGPLGQSLCLKLAEIFDKPQHAEAVKVIRREVGKALVAQSGGEEKRFPWE